MVKTGFGSGLVVLFLPLVLSAATVQVNTEGDELGDGTDCSLREAIDSVNQGLNVDACAAAGSYGAGDTVLIPEGTFTLSLAGTNEAANADGDLNVLADVTISGAGADKTIVDGGSIERVFSVDPLNAGLQVTLRGLTIRNGDAGPLSLGGGIASQSATQLTLEDTAVVENTAGQGGGIGAFGDITLERVTISGNSADTNVGGIIVNGLLTATNITVSGNTGTLSGGGVGTNSGGSITNGTIVGNAAPNGANVFVNNGTLTIRNTIVASPTDGPNCAAVSGAAIVTEGNNIEDANTCSFGASDRVDTDPLLGPLADNGGETLTHLPQAGSPAIDGVDASVFSGSDPTPADDQRRGIRPVGTAADIGAVEVGCGNGFIEHAEACDDGNTAIGDGCSDICEIEADTDGVDEDDEAGGGCSLID